MREAVWMRWRAIVLGLLLCGGWSVQAQQAAAPQGWRTQVAAFAAEHFKNPAWGFSHCERDYALARALAGEDHVTLDDDVLYAAAYLHDMAAFAPWADSKVDHADEAAQVVGPVLKDMGFPMQKLAAVQGAIRTHMYQRDPKGPEALYLHDADALDWLGAIGAARILGLVDPNGGKPTGPDAVALLQKNLAEVPPRVLSAAGRKRVDPWRQELADFLQRLGGETAAFKTL
jgi:uncharacterized protein